MGQCYRAHHRAVGTETGQTSYIQQSDRTWRQRVSRLVSKTLVLFKSGGTSQGARRSIISAWLPGSLGRLLGLTQPLNRRQLNVLNPVGIGGYLNLFKLVAQGLALDHLGV